MFGGLIYDSSIMPIISNIIWGGILLSKIGEDMFKYPIKKFRVTLSSTGEELGICTPTWLNNSQIDRITDRGISGFFKFIKPVRLGKYVLFWKKFGKEFHGLIVSDGTVRV